MAQTEIGEIKKRLARLEEVVFGMTYNDAEAIVDAYIDAAEQNPNIEASSHVLKAEKILGV